MEKRKLQLLEIADILIKDGDKNMSYADAFLEERVTESALMSKYLPLLKLVNFDELIAMIRYRCSKSLYDRYKSKGENGAYTITDEDRGHMIDEVFNASSINHRKVLLSNSKTIAPYDCTNRQLRVNLLARELEILLSGVVKLDSENRRLFYKTENSIEVIEDYDDFSFAEFISYPFLAIIPTVEVLEAIELFKKKLSYSSSYKDSVIQFDDCYIKDGNVHAGFYSEGFARFTIKRRVLKAVENRKTSVYSKELDELMLHLCNYDEQTKERFLDVVSTVFLNNSEFKQLYNFSPRIVGKDGRNGKSVFKSVIEKAFGGHTSSNVAAFRMSKLDDPRTLSHVVHALIAIDGDSSTKQISEDAAEAFKCITTGDPISVRALYGEQKRSSSNDDDDRIF